MILGLGAFEKVKRYNPCVTFDPAISLPWKQNTLPHSPFRR